MNRRRSNFSGKIEEISSGRYDDVSLVIASQGGPPGHVTTRDDEGSQQRRIVD